MLLVVFVFDSVCFPSFLFYFFQKKKGKLLKVEASSKIKYKVKTEKLEKLIFLSKITTTTTKIRKKNIRKYFAIVETIESSMQVLHIFVMNFILHLRES